MRPMMPQRRPPDASAGAETALVALVSVQLAGASARRDAGDPTATTATTGAPAPETGRAVAVHAPAGRPPRD
jgi:hypothetical protein